MRPGPIDAVTDRKTLLDVVQYILDSDWGTLGTGNFAQSPLATGRPDLALWPSGSSLCDHPGGTSNEGNALTRVYLWAGTGIRT